MRLVNLELKNYRKFDSVQLEFSDGVTGIIGSNGSGKSSLVEAIAWALYGNDVARSSKEEIRRLGSPPVEPCQVILDFELNGDHYQIVRELKGHTHTGDAAVFVNKKPQARGVTASSELIEKTLGMDSQSFLTSYFARQKELNALSDYQPAKRKEVLSRMLGIERVDTAVKKLRQDKRDLQTKLDTTQGFLVDVNQFQQQIQLKQKDANGIQEQIQRHETAFKQTQEELDSVAVDYNKSVASKDAFQTLQKQIEVKKSQLEAFGEQVISVQNEIAAIHKLQPIQVELETNLELYPKLQAQILEQEKLKQNFSTRKSLTEQLSAYQSLINQDRARLDLLNRDYPADASPQIRLGQLKQTLSELEQKIESNQNEYNTSAAQSKSLSDQVGRLQKQLSQIEKLGPQSRCDHCLRPLGEDYQSIKKHFTDEISKLEHEAQGLKVRQEGKLQDITEQRQELERLRTEWEKLQKTVHGHEQAQKEKPQLEERLRQHRINFDNLNRALSELGSDGYRADVHQELHEQFRQVEVGRDRYLRITEQLKVQPQLEEKLGELSGRKSRIEQEVKQVLAQLEQLSFDPAQFQQLEKKRDEVRLKLHQSQLNLKDLQHQKSTLCRETEQLQGRINENQKHQSQIEELQNNRLYLEKLDSILSDFKLYLIGRIRPALSRIARQLMSEMTDGKYSELELDENYDLFIYDGGQKFNLERFSGGEQDLANLCLRLAISILITESAGTDFSFIILDEVFGSQDQHRKENILKALGGLRTRFRQIFLITHIDDIKDQVESLINVFENEDGTSRLETTWQTV